MNWNRWNWVPVVLALGLIAIGIAQVFDASPSHDLERPLAMFTLVIGVIWLAGRIGWWIVWSRTKQQ